MVRVNSLYVVSRVAIFAAGRVLVTVCRFVWCVLSTLKPHENRVTLHLGTVAISGPALPAWW